VNIRNTKWWTTLHHKYMYLKGCISVQITYIPETSHYILTFS